MWVNVFSLFYMMREVIIEWSIENNAYESEIRLKFRKCSFLGNGPRDDDVWMHRRQQISLNSKTSKQPSERWQLDESDPRCKKKNIYIYIYKKREITRSCDIEPDVRTFYFRLIYVLQQNPFFFLQITQIDFHRRRKKNCISETKEERRIRKCKKRFRYKFLIRNCLTLRHFCHTVPHLTTYLAVQLRRSE